MTEEEIRPQAIFHRYLELAARDTEVYFSQSELEIVACPACGATGEDVFTKHGFTYQECPDCRTLFVSPRPPNEDFSRFYQEAESVKYWATTFYKETAEARRVKLWQPKARLVYSFLESVGARDHNVVDIGGGYGIFAEEYQRLSGRAVTVVEPGPPLAAACRERGLSVIKRFLEELSSDDLPGGGNRAFVSFELFEHLHAPSEFLKSLHGLMVPGDWFIFTTLSGAGVDIRSLWNDSKSVFPPHHLNFLNPQSVSILLRAGGFDSVTVTTPGKLDMDIMFNNQHLIKDRSWQVVLQQSDARAREKWQQFISENNYSSHMMVSCRKA